MSNNTTEIDEDIAEIIVSHFPNASRKVMQEMAVELHKLLVEARTQELKRLVRESGWRLSDSHLEIEMKVVRDRINSLKGRKDK